MILRTLWAGLIALVLSASSPGLQAVSVKPITVRDLNGVQRVLPESAKKATVLFFITHDCPISNSYAPEMNRICAQYGPKDIAFFMVYVESGFPGAEIKKHAKAFGYVCPLLSDSTRALAKRTHATVTPEAIVLDPTGKEVYRGRINDLYLDFGKTRYQATTRDLRDALDAVLQGKPVPHPTTRAVGCYIPMS